MSYIIVHNAILCLEGMFSGTIRVILLGRMLIKDLSQLRFSRIACSVTVL